MTEFIHSLKSLLVVSVINFILVTSITVGALYLIDKVKESKQKKKEEE